MIGPGGPKACGGRKRPAWPRESASGTTPPRPRVSLLAHGPHATITTSALARVPSPSQSVQPLAVGTQGRHARAEAERRAVALGGAHEAVGDEQRLGVAARRLVAADGEIVRGQARLELEDAVDVAQLDLHPALAHRLVDAADRRARAPAGPTTR